ncbi:hypothetical protein Acr_23g0004510 [Actinidia rufa]|uniref:Uncharacterized protein n=1 Tax=Actinidia rufa TaxID=165716 RepID=A0A7J0GML8_9ERIC|nr:hypothetical protein Acr_23g0004510 [Actinidia rufa]
MARLLTPTVAPPVAYRSTGEACQFPSRSRTVIAPSAIDCWERFPTRSGRVSTRSGRVSDELPRKKRRFAVLREIRHHFARFLQLSSAPVRRSTRFSILLFWQEGVRGSYQCPYLLGKLDSGLDSRGSKHLDRNDLKAIVFTNGDSRQESDIPAVKC